MQRKEKPRLLLIGYWKENPLDEWPDPDFWVDKTWNQEKRDRVIRYLKEGKTIAAYDGWSECRFRCDEGVMLGNDEQTDGVYVWPRGLPHYLEKHGVRLPQRFVEHALTYQPEVPEEWDHMTVPNYDMEWWKGCSGDPWD